MSTFVRKPFTYYSVDIDYQKSIPIGEIAKRLGVSFKKSEHCFCPDPNCPDAISKRPSAHITGNNTIHCFVCGNTWNNFTLTGMRVFGYEGKECYASGKSITHIGKYIAEDLGFGGARALLHDKEGISKEFSMPQVQSHDINGKPITFPLWRCIGLSKNPFAPVYVHAERKDPENEKKANGSTVEKIQLSETEAILMVTLKCLEALRIANDYELTDDPDELLLRDYEALRIAIEGYLRKLQPYILSDDRKAVQSELLYQYVFTEDDAYRVRLSRIFPDDMKLIVENIEKLEMRQNEQEKEMEYE